MPETQNFTVHGAWTENSVDDTSRDFRSSGGAHGTGTGKSLVQGSIDRHLITMSISELLTRLPLIDLYVKEFDTTAIFGTAWDISEASCSLSAKPSITAVRALIDSRHAPIC